MQPELIIMCGLARSGKSTWIKKNKINQVVVSPDEIRHTIFNHQFFDPAEEMIWALSRIFARLLLQQGFSVIVDACSLNPESRRKWLMLKKHLDIKCKVVWVDTPLDKCLENNENPLDNRRVPIETLTSMDRYFIPPEQGESYYDFELIIVDNDS